MNVSMFYGKFLQFLKRSLYRISWGGYVGVFFGLLFFLFFGVVFIEVSRVWKARNYLSVFIGEVIRRSDYIVNDNRFVNKERRLRVFYEQLFSFVSMCTLYRVEYKGLGIRLFDGRMSEGELTLSASYAPEFFVSDGYLVYLYEDDGKRVELHFVRSFFDSIRFESFVIMMIFFVVMVVAFMCAFVWTVRMCEGGAAKRDVECLSQLSRLMERDDTLRASLEYSRVESELCKQLPWNRHSGLQS